MVTILSKQASAISHYLRELRDVEIQKDPARFGRNVERLGLIAGYEISKKLEYNDHLTNTPLGQTNTPLPKDRLVLATVLRAGLALQHGLHQVFDQAELAFVAAGRKPETGKEVEIDLSYVAGPELNNKVLILADTMLATGKSLVESYEALVAKLGKPKRVFVVSVIASQAGVDFVAKQIPEAELFVCAVDPDLNDKFYIVPGLGDAGDLLYGTKSD